MNQPQNLIEIINNKYEIILASRSKRRHELLSQLGFQFKIIDNIDIDETPPKQLRPSEIAKYIAQKKAKAITAPVNNQLIITCDTIVVHNETIMGKPATQSEAAKYLSLISGNKHQVISGVCITTKYQTKLLSDTTTVWFAPLSQEEINHYTTQYNTIDKAGGYGIQEWIGMIGVSKISGSYFNVMGLPTHKLYSSLKQFV